MTVLEGVRIFTSENLR